MVLRSRRSSQRRTERCRPARHHSLADTCWAALQKGPENPYFRTVLVGGTSEYRANVLEEVAGHAVVAGWPVLSLAVEHVDEDGRTHTFADDRQPAYIQECGNVLMLVEEMHTLPSATLVKMIKTWDAQATNWFPEIAHDGAVNVGWLASCPSHHTAHLKAASEFAALRPVEPTTGTRFPAV